MLQRYDKPRAETSLSLELCQDKNQLFENAVTEESRKQDETISSSDFAKRCCLVRVFYGSLHIDQKIFLATYPLGCMYNNYIYNYTGDI